MAKNKGYFQLGEYTFTQTANKCGSTVRMECAKPEQNKPYIITYNDCCYGDSAFPGWSCDCPAWKFKKGEIRNCKHLKMLIPYLEGKAA